MDFFKKLDPLNTKAVDELRNEIQGLKGDLIEAHNTSNFTPLFHFGYNGEKNTGELGVITKYHLEYDNLRHRSWKAYLDDEVASTIINRYVMWIIGKGLKYQSEPVESILKEEKIELNIEEFTTTVEDRFFVYGKSKMFDYKKIDSLNGIAKTTYINAIVGGDVLVIPRVIKGNLNVQLVDGSHIKTPPFGDHQTEAAKRGNIIKNGIEENPKGEHVAFYVQKRNDASGFQASLEFDRIPAKGVRTGRKTAFLVYGLRYRLDDNRGIPILSTILETLKKLDRYKEAIVGTLEERAKIVYQIVHQEFSTGETPLQAQLAKTRSIDGGKDVATDVHGKQLADNIAVTTNKSTYNMPQGARMEAIEARTDTNFKDFYLPNVHLACAAIGIPPEVALSKYDSNFSASRAALKDWEHTIEVDRAAFSYQFYEPLKDYWFELEVLKGKIFSPGFLNALLSKNQMVIDAYLNGRFVGANVPHIDPLKEVAAERAKLGPTLANAPLTTVENATEALNGGDSRSNIKKAGKELEEVEKAGLKIEEKPVEVNKK